MIWNQTQILNYLWFRITVLGSSSPAASLTVPGAQIYKSIYNFLYLTQHLTISNFFQMESPLTILIPDTVLAQPERFSRGGGYRRLFPTGKAGHQPHQHHHLVEHHPMDRLCRCQFGATSGRQSLVKELVQACLPPNHGDPWPPGKPWSPNCHLAGAYTLIRIMWLKMMKMSPSWGNPIYSYMNDDYLDQAVTWDGPIIRIKSTKDHMKQSIMVHKHIYKVHTRGL